MRGHERVGQSRRRVPLGQSAVTRRSDLYLPLAYPIGLSNRRKRLVKVSLIIVNDAPKWVRAPPGRNGNLLSMRSPKFLASYCGRHAAKGVESRLYRLGAAMEASGHRARVVREVPSP